MGTRNWFLPKAQLKIKRTGGLARQVEGRRHACVHARTCSAEPVAVRVSVSWVCHKKKIQLILVEKKDVSLQMAVGPLQLNKKKSTDGGSFQAHPSSLAIE